MSFKPIAYNGILPKISDKALIAPNAIISGDTEIADDVGIWYNVVIRGDVAPIKIGKGSNIQDNSVIHVLEQIMSRIKLVTKKQLLKYVTE